MTTLALYLLAPLGYVSAVVVVVRAFGRGRTAPSVGERGPMTDEEAEKLLDAIWDTPRPTRMEPRPSTARPIRGATLAEYGTGYGGLLGALTREGQEILERERRRE